MRLGFELVDFQILYTRIYKLNWSPPFKEEVKAKLFFNFYLKFLILCALISCINRWKVTYLKLSPPPPSVGRESFLDNIFKKLAIQTPPRRIWNIYYIESNPNLKIGKAKHRAKIVFSDERFLLIKSKWCNFKI